MLIVLCFAYPIRRFGAFEPHHPLQVCIYFGVPVDIADAHHFRNGLSTSKWALYRQTTSALTIERILFSRFSEISRISGIRADRVSDTVSMAASLPFQPPHDPVTLKIYLCIGSIAVVRIAGHVGYVSGGSSPQLPALRGWARCARWVHSSVADRIPSPPDST